MTLKTALVVDDSKLARITLQRLLEKKSLSVTTAESGIQALDLLETQLPDVIFMDHLMPELDGFETTQKIKASPRTQHIPVIMCSGKEGVDNYEEQAIGIGACGILSKPPQPEKLVEVLGVASTAQQHALANQSTTKTPVPPGLSEEALEPLLARLDRLEKQQVELPSFDGFNASLQDLQERVGSLYEVTEALQNQPAAEISDAPAAIDSEALAAGITTDVENTLRPLLESELKSLEERVMTGLDEALSEAKHELDNHLSTLESQIPELTPEPQEEASDALRAQLQTQSEESELRIQAQLEAGLNSQKEALLAETLEKARTQSEEQLSSARADWEQWLNERLASLAGEQSEVAPAVDPEALKSEWKADMDALESRVGEHLAALPSVESDAPNEESLINSVMAAVTEQLHVRDEEIEALKAQLAERPHDGSPSEADLSSVDADSKISEKDVDDSGSFSMVALAALIVALVALAKAFALF